MSSSQPLVQIGLLGEAIDTAPVVVLVADEVGRFVAVNQHACKLLGYTREELLTLNVVDIGAETEVEAHYTDFVARRQPDKGVYTVRRKDGTTFSFRYRAGETKIAGMTYFVSVGVEADET